MTDQLPKSDTQPNASHCPSELSFYIQKALMSWYARNI